MNAPSTDEITLPTPLPSGSVTWSHPEREYFSDIFGTEVVTNVSQPRLIPCLPESPNGTAIVVCPGGGFHALSINREGFDVARWLCDRGITAFILKYRLVPSTTDDAVRDLATMMREGKSFEEASRDIISLAHSDGLTALQYVREHASDFDIDAGRIGMVGFSAGGSVAVNAAIHYEPSSRPDFVAPIYSPARPAAGVDIPADAPPMFLLAATDDQLGLAADSIELYNRWHQAARPVELHLYANGGHGFGMLTQNLPSDAWIERLGEWLAQQGLIASG